MDLKGHGFIRAAKAAKSALALASEGILIKLKISNRAC